MTIKRQYTVSTMHDIDPETLPDGRRWCTIMHHNAADEPAENAGSFCITQHTHEASKEAVTTRLASDHDTMNSSPRHRRKSCVFSDIPCTSLTDEEDAHLVAMQLHLALDEVKKETAKMIDCEHHTSYSKSSGSIGKGKGIVAHKLFMSRYLLSNLFS